MRIQGLSIAAFRGIPGRIDLDFRGPSGVASSLLIVGDNGSGKSSIIDALEFALQSRISGSQSRWNPLLPSPVSFAKTDTAFTQVMFNDGSTIKRELVIAVDGKWNFDSAPHRLFAFAPMVLRRSDILRFWETPDIKKQVMFFQYFSTTGNAPLRIELAASDQMMELEQRRLTLKQQRRELLAAFAETAKVPIDSIPLGTNDFHEFMRNIVYGGISSKKRKTFENRGMRISGNPKLEKLWKEIHQVTTEVGKVQRRLSEFKKEVEPDKYSGRKRTVAEGLSRIGELVTQAFRRLSPSSSFIQNIEIKMGILSEVSMSLSVVLKNGTRVEPRQIFSEANLDLLAFLVFIGVIRESAERGQAKVLILDDVLQSVDSGIRIELIDYLLKELGDWQFILTVHDRLWREQLRSLFNRAGHSFVEKEIVGWEFESGPRIISNSYLEVDNLTIALEKASPQTICLESGILLERVSNTLSYSLAIPVTRKRDDKYTLGDLWPGIYKVLRKTSIATEAETVDRWLHLRNLVGAHYNEWATSLSRDEAMSFGRGTEALLRSVTCDQCHRTIEEVRTASGSVLGWRCRCGHRQVEKVGAVTS